MSAAGQSGRSSTLRSFLLVVLVLGVIGVSLLGTIGALALLFVGSAGMVPAVGALLYVLLFCVPVGLRVLLSRGGRLAQPLRLPHPLVIGGVAFAAIVVGQIATLGALTVLALPGFWLAAMLPPLAALAFACLRLPGATTWRRALFGLLTGSLLSTTVTLLLGGVVGLLGYVALMPLREIVAHVLASPGLERLFYSPALVVAMVGSAVVAPLVEEMTKPIGALILMRRLRSSTEAFVVGMACGVGFAVMENMLYQASGSSAWGAVATLRGIGGVLHPLNAGMVTLGWYGALRGTEPGRWERLLALYGLAVGSHALWNGGLTLLFSVAGAYFFATDTWRVDIYGVGQPVVVLAFMVLEAVALWRLLLLVGERLGPASAAATPAGLGLGLDRPRRLAIWATAVFALIVPIGVVFGPLLAHYAERLTATR
ncbi:MAG: PrsW family glutamic-type intramembrane protease [Chloroflexota bacterium]